MQLPIITVLCIGTVYIYMYTYKAVGKSIFRRGVCFTTRKTARPTG